MDQGQVGKAVVPWVCPHTSFSEEVPTGGAAGEARPGHWLRHLLCQQHRCAAGAALGDRTGKGHTAGVLFKPYFWMQL